MKIMEAIAALDELKPNAFPERLKVKWLSELDTRLYGDVLCHYTDAPESFEGYGEDADRATILLAPEPYDRMYLFWLEAQVDYWLGETARYNNALATFEAEYAAFAAAYHRRHPHKSVRPRWF